MKLVRYDLGTFLQCLRQKLRPKAPLGRVLRIAIYGIGLLCIIYIFNHTKEGPVSGALVTALAVLLTHLVINSFVDPLRQDLQDFTKAVSLALAPLQTAILAQNERLLKIEERQSLIESALATQSAISQEFENRLNTLYDVVFATSANPRIGIRELAKLNFCRICDDLRQGERLVVGDTFIPHFHLYRDAVKRAIKRGAKFRFFVLHPDSAIAQMHRPRQILRRACYASFPQGIRDYWDEIQKVALETAKERPGAIECKFYSGPPGFPIYLVEGKSGAPRCAHQSFFLLQPSVYNLHLVWVEAHMLGAFQEFLTWRWDNETDDFASEPLAA